MWQEEQDRLYIHIHVDRYIILYRKRERKLLTFWGWPSYTYVVDDSLQEKIEGTQKRDRVSSSI
jgi:hypothetical protein